MKVDIGDRVEKDAELIVIDTPESVAGVKRQEAEVLAQRSEKGRLQASADVAVSELDTLRAQIVAEEAKKQEVDTEVVAQEAQFARFDRLVAGGSVTSDIRDEALKRRDSARATVATVAARIAPARAALRVGSLAAKAAVSGQMARIAVEESRLLEMQVALQFAVVKAPFDGVIVNRTANVGDLVRSGSTGTLLTIAKLDVLRLRIAVPEKDAVAVGDEVTFSPRVGRQLQITGAVSRMSNLIDTHSRSMMVEVDIPNEELNLLPGMYGYVTIHMGDAQARLMLPADSIRFPNKGGEAMVYVVDGGKVRHVTVKTGLDNGTHIELTDGLDGSESIVTGMLGRLEDNQAVTVISNWPKQRPTRQ